MKWPPNEVAAPPSGPTFRPSARVVLLDERGRTLLLKTESSRLDVPSLWTTPGGGLEPGESYEAAALRELAEETGLSQVALGPLIWVRRHIWRWGERWIESLEHYFFVRAPGGFVVSTGAFTAHERDVIKEIRWWSADEMATSGELFVPRRFAELLVPLAQGEIPTEPINPGL